jgi:2-dehydro-3-deoxy-D-gluconate 5-dehydrogenase
MAGPFDLTGRRALVTGGGGGIGRGLARALADAGASVAVLGRSESADEAAAELGGIAVRADLADRDDLRGGFADAVARLGGLDILVASHGIGRAADAVDHDLADWDEVIEVNLTATFELCQLAGRIMVA